MPNLVMWPESSLDIALWIKFKMAAILQGQTKFVLNKQFRQNRSKFMILVSTITFSHTHHLVALSRKHLRHIKFYKPRRLPSDEQTGKHIGVT